MHGTRGGRGALRGANNRHLTSQRATPRRRWGLGNAVNAPTLTVRNGSSENCQRVLGPCLLGTDTPEYGEDLASKMFWRPMKRRAGLAAFEGMSEAANT
jgi:hypothetical protein